MARRLDEFYERIKLNQSRKSFLHYCWTMIGLEMRRMNAYDYTRADLERSRSLHSRLYAYLENNMRILTRSHVENLLGECFNALGAFSNKLAQVSQRFTS